MDAYLHDSTTTHQATDDSQDEQWVNEYLSDTARMASTSTIEPAPTDFPILKEDDPSSFRLTPFLYFAAVVLVLYWGYLHCKKYYTAYVMKRDTLEKRRRLGIPDEDKRPFNIAYNAAAQRRREEEEARRQEEEREAQANMQQNTPWVQYGREIGQPTFVNNSLRVPGRDGLLFRQPTRPLHQPLLNVNQNGFPFHNTLPRTRSPLFNDFVPQQNFNYGVSPQPQSIDVTNWQDRYIPEPVAQAQRTARRPRVEKARTVGSATTLGRRSRKHLNLEVDPEVESDNREPSRRRLNDWGRDHDIDGDNEARWAYEGEAFPPSDAPLKEFNRTRKRDQDEEDVDEGNAPLRSRRKVIGEIPQPKSAPATTRTQKRKDRDDDGETNDQDAALLAPRPTVKKRVRVLSYHSSLSEKGKEIEMKDDHTHDDENDLPKEPLARIRKIGEHWEEDGVNFKVGPKGKRLREVLVKEKHQKYQMPADSKHKDRKAFIYTVIKKWLTDEQYTKAQADGLVYDETKHGKFSPSKEGKLILSDDGTEESVVRSEHGSEWGSVNGQTPLKSGFLRTTGGYDRPPIPALFRTQGQQVEQARLAHVGSPGKKTLAHGAALPRALKGASKWERQNREAQALAALKLSRSKSKPEVIPRESENVPAVAAAPIPASSETSSVKPSPLSMPNLFVPAPKPSGALKEVPAPAAVHAFPSFAAPPTLPAVAEVKAAAPSITVTPPVNSTGPTNPPANPFFVGSSAPKPAAETPSSTNAAPAFQFSAPQNTNAAGAPASSTSTAGNLFSLATPTGNAFTPAPQAPESTKPATAPAPFGFGQPAATTPSSTGAAPAINVPSFGANMFGRPTETKNESNPSSSTQVPSLFGAKPTNPAVPTPSTEHPSSTKPFSISFGNGGFGGAQATESKPNPFGAVNGTTTAAAPPNPFASQNPFSGFGTAPAANKTSNDSAPKQSPFGSAFGQPSAAASSTPAPDAPKPINIFGAAASSAPSPFAPQPSTNTSAPPASTTEAKKTFGFGGTSAFGSNGASATSPLPFGTFGNNNTSAFGSAAAPAAENKPATSMFGFGGATSNGTADKPSMGQKPISFGNGATTDAGSAANSPAPTATGFNFGGPAKQFAFGVASGSGTGNAGAQPNGAGPSAFGKPAAGAFAFGNLAVADASRATTPAAEGTPSPADPVFALGRGTSPHGGRPRRPLPRRP